VGHSTHRGKKGKLDQGVKHLEGLVRAPPVTSQHVGELRGSLEGFCAWHLKLRDFFALLSLKPKGDRFSLRGGMVYSWSAKEFDMISFDLLLVGIW
jgi:hypothetical protein